MDGSNIFTQLRLRALMHKYVTVSLIERYEQKSMMIGKLIEVSMRTITLLVDNKNIYKDKETELPIDNIFKVVAYHEDRK